MEMMINIIVKVLILFALIYLSWALFGGIIALITKLIKFSSESSKKPDLSDLETPYKDTTTCIELHFSGDGFKPSSLINLTNLPIIINREAGEIAANGKYKGQPSPYGLAYMVLDYDDPKLRGLLDKTLKSLALHKDSFKEIGLDEINMEIRIGDENNFFIGFNEENLKEINELNITLYIMSH